MAAVLALIVVAGGGVIALRDQRGVPGDAVAAAATTSASAVGEATSVPSEPAAPVATTTTTAPSTPAATPLAGKIKPGTPRTGVATFYDSDGGGACSYDPGPDPLTAAMNVSDYEDSQACGAYVLVRANNGKSITVRITNLCPAPCRVGQLDLSAEAFAMLAPPVTGELPITWTLVSPPLTKKMSVRYKTGSSRWWCGIQVVDHRNPVARLEVLAGGKWQALRRAEYNYFLSENGAGCGGAIAVTDLYGERLLIDPLPVKPGELQATSQQFAGH